MFGHNIQLAKILIFFGILLLTIGVLLHFFGNFFSWVGSLPGDIKVKNENFSIYLPLTSMIVLSLLLNIIIKLYMKLFS